MCHFAAQVSLTYVSENVVYKKIASNCEITKDQVRVPVTSKCCCKKKVESLPERLQQSEEYG
jgi:hypothetical protein